MDKSNNLGTPGHLLRVLAMNPRRVLSRLVKPLPQWSAVALADPQTQMTTPGFLCAARTAVRAGRRLMVFAC